MIVFIFLLINCLNFSFSIVTDDNPNIDSFLKTCQHLNKEKICDDQNTLSKEEILNEIILFNSSFVCPCHEKCQPHSGILAFVIITDLSSSKNVPDINENLLEFLRKNITSPCENFVIFLMNNHHKKIHIRLGKAVEHSSCHKVAHQHNTISSNPYNYHISLLTFLKNYRNCLEEEHRNLTFKNQVTALVFNGSTWTLLLNHFLFFIIISLHVLLVLLS